MEWLHSKVRNHPFGIKEYVYRNQFNDKNISDILNHLEKKYYSVGKVDPINFGLQTPREINLFSDDKFKKLSDTFLKSVRKYVNYQKLIDNFNLKKYNINAWCYSNWKSSTREESGVWHVHNAYHSDAISGIFYLKLPKTSGGETLFHIAGNEFELPSKELSWFIFPSCYIHAPGKVSSPEKRYVISCDIWFDKMLTKTRY